MTTIKDNLNILDYSLDDVLNLFKLTIDFTEDDLVLAKKIVYKTHPDKSKLHPDYFRFYFNAYKVLYEIYIQSKKAISNTQTQLRDDAFMSCEDKDKLNAFFKENPELTTNHTLFNKWFTKQYDKYTACHHTSAHKDINQLKLKKYTTIQPTLDDKQQYTSLVKYKQARDTQDITPRPISQQEMLENAKNNKKMYLNSIYREEYDTQRSILLQNNLINNLNMLTNS